MHNRLTGYAAVGKPRKTRAQFYVFYLDFGSDWIRCGATGLNCIDGYFGSAGEAGGRQEAER